MTSKTGRKCDWERARQLAEQGVWMSHAAKLLGIHHTTALYIGRQMGFRWGKCPWPTKPQVESLPRRKPIKKPVQSEMPAHVHDVRRVEWLMRLAERCARSPHL
jgi:hypothetical protein